jgi:hypothetical protein
MLIFSCPQVMTPLYVGKPYVEDTQYFKTCKTNDDLRNNDDFEVCDIAVISMGGFLEPFAFWGESSPTSVLPANSTQGVVVLPRPGKVFSMPDVGGLSSMSPAAILAGPSKPGPNPVNNIALGATLVAY